jgi:AbrB family looped-hinge helix DNA binding protein
MAMTTISPKFQIVIPKEVREKLHLVPSQRLQIVEKDESSPWCQKSP